MSAAALASFRRTITVAWPNQIEADARKLLIRTAKEGHAEIVSKAVTRGGVAPQFTAFANEPGRAVEAVILPGPIVYRYQYLREVIVAALKALDDASPVRSGRYKRSHTLFINGVAVAGVPEEIPPGADIMIANPVPYARRLEVGKTKSGRSFVIQVQPHIYERTVKKVLIPRFKDVAQISFSYATLPGAWVVRGGLSSHYGVFDEAVRKTAQGKRWDQIPDFVKKDFVFQRRRQQGRHVGQGVRSPAIVISGF